MALAITGYAALGLGLLGVLLVASRRRVGWVLCTASSALWIGYGLWFGAEPLALNGALFTAVNSYGWWNSRER